MPATQPRSARSLACVPPIAERAADQGRGGRTLAACATGQRKNLGRTTRFCTFVVRSPIVRSTAGFVGVWELLFLTVPGVLPVCFVPLWSTNRTMKGRSKNKGLEPRPWTAGVPNLDTSLGWQRGCFREVYGGATICHQTGSLMSSMWVMRESCRLTLIRWMSWSVEP